MSLRGVVDVESERRARIEDIRHVLESLNVPALVVYIPTKDRLVQQDAPSEVERDTRDFARWIGADCVNGALGFLREDGRADSRRLVTLRRALGAGGLGSFRPFHGRNRAPVGGRSSPGPVAPGQSGRPGTVMGTALSNVCAATYRVFRSLPPKVQFELNPVGTVPSALAAGE